MSSTVHALTQTVPRYLLASVFLLAAQARFTSFLTPAFHDYETSKSVRTQQKSWLGPWLHQRVAAIPVGLVGLGLLVPDSLKGSSTMEPRQLRGSSALGAIVLLTMGMTARVKSGMGVGLPASMTVLSLWVAFMEFAPSFLP